MRHNDLVPEAITGESIMNPLKRIVLLILISGQAWAGSKLLNVQGKLTDSAGNALTGTYTVTFRIYAKSGDPIASALWTESQSLATQGGAFNVNLGNGSALDPIPFNKPYYLGMQVAGDPNELTPRQLLGASAYAHGSLGDFSVGQNVSVSSSATIGSNVLVGNNA